MLRESSIEHAEEVLLRHRRLDDEDRPEQAEEDEAERREAQRRQHDAIARPAARVTPR